MSDKHVRSQQAGRWISLGNIGWVVVIGFGIGWQAGAAVVLAIVATVMACALYT